LAWFFRAVAPSAAIKEAREPHDWFSSNKSVRLKKTGLTKHQRSECYYKTSALKSTLERLIDFDRINHVKEMRLSVGAVNVRTGHFDYFDSEKITIRPEHVMASGAIPPGFPPIEIDGEKYWDGGLFSNTPLAYMVDYYPRRSRLIFQVDVFPAHGRVPTNLAEVTERDKDIRYSSRTRLTTNNLHNIRTVIITKCAARGAAS
jgi:NTE family protein